ncbi:MAG: acyl carrier protein [Bacteroidetes bacterium]|nr:acyl carrier protein [Bacteroidota bacterium]MBS1933453.1 acyl carrier protein [Bacteroidota bacterium]
MIITIEGKKVNSIIKKIIAEKFALDEDEIQDDANFQNDLGVDSLDIIELQIAIEKEFKIKIEDEEVEKMKTLSSIIDLIEKKSNYGHL